MKVCSRCKIAKDESKFHGDASRKDGRFPYCIDCEKKRISKRDFKGSEKKRREKWPEKIRATRLVQQMVLSGSLIKEPCFICGNEKVEGHHLFYDHPSKVLWLCPEHHRKFHRVWKETK